MKQSKQPCRKCSAPIYWSKEDKEKSGKWHPLNADGTNHKCSNQQKEGDDMGAPKARNIISVNSPGETGCTVTIRHDNNDFDDYPISELGRTDLRRAYALAGFNASPTTTNEDMVARLTGQPVSVPVPAPQPAPAAPGSIDAIVDGRINAAIESGAIGATVDEDAVRAIVADAVASVGVVRVEVRLPDTERDLSGMIHKAVPHVIKIAALAMATGIKWPLLVGPTGSGKSQAMGHVCEALGIEYVGAISCDETMDRSDLFGFKSPVTGEVQRTMFRDAYQLGGGFLADELDNATANLTSGLNQALSNGACAFPGEDRLTDRHGKNLTAGAANTFGHGGDRDYVGRNELDAAFLDRWAMIEFGYDEDLERKLALSYATAETRVAVLEWLTLCHRTRAKVMATKARMFVTSRTVAAGAAWVGTGSFTVDQTAEALVWSGVKREVREKVTA